MNCREDGCDLKPIEIKKYHQRKYSNLTSVSKWLSNDCGFATFTASSSSQLTGTFDTISQLIKLQAKAWILMDPMGENINFLQFNTQSTNASYSDRLIRWDLKTEAPEISEDQDKNAVYSYNLSYKVKLDNLKAGFEAADDTGTPLYYAVNGITKLTYFIQEEDEAPNTDRDLKNAYFNVPSVKGLVGTLEFTKTDGDGKALAGAGFTLTAYDNPDYKLTASSDENGKVIFCDIPSGHVYTLEETTVPEGYKKAENTEISVAFGVVSGITGGIITNQPETTSVSGIKIWKDDNNQAQKRPDSITINLIKNGEVINSKKVTSKEQWSWTFDNLAKYENGELIKYTISENAVAGYIPQYNGYNVTNTYKPKVNPPIGQTYTSVSVHKEWKLDDGGTAADSVTVQLYRNGVKYPGGEAKLSEENNWSYTWRPVYAYGDNWTVEELNVPEGFAASVTKAAYSNDFTITNDDVKPEPENPTDPTKPELSDPTKPEKPTKPENPAKPCKPDTEVPKTGDTAADTVLVNTFVLILSALGGTALWHRRKEKNQISQ